MWFLWRSCTSPPSSSGGGEVGALRRGLAAVASIKAISASTRRTAKGITAATLARIGLHADGCTLSELARDSARCSAARRRAGSCRERSARRICGGSWKWSFGRSGLLTRKMRRKRKRIHWRRGLERTVGRTRSRLGPHPPPPSPIRTHTRPGEGEEVTRWRRCDGGGCWSSPASSSAARLSTARLWRSRSHLGSRAAAALSSGASPQCIEDLGHLAAQLAGLRSFSLSLARRAARWRVVSACSATACGFRPAASRSPRIPSRGQPVALSPWSISWHSGDRPGSRRRALCRSRRAGCSSGRRHERLRASRLRRIPSAEFFEARGSRSLSSAPWLFSAVSAR